MFPKDDAGFLGASNTLNAGNKNEEKKGIKRKRIDEKKEIAMVENPKSLSPNVGNTESPIKVKKGGISSSINHLLDDDDFYDML
jgi:hypothetical protein